MKLYIIPILAICCVKLIESYSTPTSFNISASEIVVTTTEDGGYRTKDECQEKCHLAESIVGKDFIKSCICTMEESECAQRTEDEHEQYQSVLIFRLNYEGKLCLRDKRCRRHFGIGGKKLENNYHIICKVCDQDIVCLKSDEKKDPNTFFIICIGSLAFALLALIFRLFSPVCFRKLRSTSIWLQWNLILVLFFWLLLTLMSLIIPLSKTKCMIIAVFSHWMFTTFLVLQVSAALNLNSAVNSLTDQNYYSTPVRRYVIGSWITSSFLCLAPIVLRNWSTDILGDNIKEESLGVCWLSGQITQIVFVISPILLSTLLNIILYGIISVKFQKILLYSPPTLFGTKRDEMYLYIKLTVFFGIYGILVVLKVFIDTTILEFLVVLTLALIGTWFSLITMINRESMKDILESFSRSRLKYSLKFNSRRGFEPYSQFNV
ncbi:DgyrCDS2890 [Dimorphilus gyrociliatus]|uniref:DgyrCDS2890 n=1 Tax=Dimorphilus gyrociliatus TaxID=2664684 RepID=A0A7I8VBL3_9ANNE|nr:DgyrCDS2890 [Dimorphilus gyrociliatus]